MSLQGEPSLFVRCCCCCCIQICYPQEEKKFAGVEYELVPSTKEVPLDQPSLPVPRKSFFLPQEKADFAVPIQLHEEKGVHGSTHAVKLQPTRMRTWSIPEGYGSTGQGYRRTMSLPTPLSRSSALTSMESVSCPLNPPVELCDPESSGSWRPSLPSIEDQEEEEEEGEGKEGGGGSRATAAPEIEFSLYYDIQCRTLTVHLQCARHLPLKSKKVTLNPIVILYLVPNREDILESKIVENSTNPYFDQSLEFKGLLPDEIRRQRLIFRIYSQSAKGDLLGGLALPLSEADLFGMKYRMKIDTDTEKLKMVTRGDMLLSLVYNPVSNRLQGVLLKATNLQKQDIVGLADPYVKIWMLHKGRRSQKWKSSTKRNTLIPIFNEAFQFDIVGMDIKDVALEVLMMDYDRFSRNDVVGVVYLGDGVPHNTGRQHWDQIIAQPNVSISNWHTILPITSSTERTTRKRRISEPVVRSKSYEPFK